MKPSDLVKGLVVAATTCALVYGGGAQATGAEDGDDAPDAPAVFVDNDPNGTAQDVPAEYQQYRIRDYLVNLIEGAGKGSDITIASYRFDDQKVANALVKKIEDDDVKVRVIVDAEHAGKKPYKYVEKAVDGRTSWIKNCGDLGKSDGNKHTSCIGDHIMHNKFYLFSKTRGQSNVVVQTSSNLSDHSGPKMWNTAFTAMGDDGKWLYDKYQEYFFDLSTEEKRADQYQHFIDEHGPVSNAKYKMYVSPRKESSSNVTFANILKSVKCDGNTSGGTNDKEHRTIVRVAAAQIAKGGGAAVAAELWRLDNEGCYVDVVGTDVSQAKDGPLRGGLLRAPTGKFHGPEVREFSKNQCGTHEKNILIDGNYAGNGDQKVVFTGSHNLNRKSPWHNDDVILRITDADVHEKFKDHFFKIRAAAAVTWQTSKFDTYDPDDLKFNC
ncbi:phosphatidylserine/phosphatidylglycerophosphate/cardiolipin synthase-like enzyme [Kribbella sp. VKM Ac-2569]|uniref:phospholipase D-like domain-containing protein n=1 Tax=Kribbella sp. VKM Ac-2569 TaxID=2512220 RepID=UPI0010EF659C|nr:phospholipase D-like domain-containing protein [Kribbella sp. VKM Ac-2569]RZT17430.1 phosphatidylserine/phosphatidylglycerophosphate/cardiolipin synthase-like enzyme [Kribbella sp. VKM Ac-2569]